MSNISIIASVTNKTNLTVGFVNTETSGNNCTINPGDTVTIGAWVPWADNPAEFPPHHLQLSAYQNVYYIFQSGPSVFGSAYAYGQNVNTLASTGSTLNLVIGPNFNITVSVEG